MVVVCGGGGRGEEMKAARGRACELCGRAAGVHCESDAAFLCWPCDAGVHGANFLVARHLRRVACAGCGALDDDRVVSGYGAALPVRSLCSACGPARTDLSSDSESASCVSTAESAAVGRPGARARRACAAGTPATTLRVRLAAAMWCAARRRRAGGAWEAAAALRRLEAAAGVPAKLIVRAATRGRVRGMAMEEGWAECC